MSVYTGLTSSRRIVATKTIARYNRQRARKLERKDEDLVWAMSQRMRHCGLCGKGYIANSREAPTRMRVRRWKGVELCRGCQANRLDIIQALLKMGVLKYTKQFKEKIGWPARWKRRDTLAFVMETGATWGQGCDICLMHYVLMTAEGRRLPKLRWKGMTVCHDCLKSIRLIPRLIELGIVKYSKEYR